MIFRGGILPAAVGESCLSAPVSDLWELCTELWEQFTITWCFFKYQVPNSSTNNFFSAGSSNRCVLHRRPSLSSRRWIRAMRNRISPIRSWWSDAMSALRLFRTPRRLCLYFRLKQMWSIWFSLCPSRETHVTLCTSRRGKSDYPINMSLLPRILKTAHRFH